MRTTHLTCICWRSWWRAWTSSPCSRTLMKTLAVTDEKSGLLKRSSYIDVLLSEVPHSMQQGTPLSLMLMQFGTPAMLRDVPDKTLGSMMQQLGQTVCAHI